MPGQHRKQSSTPRVALFAVGTIAATVLALVVMMTRPAEDPQNTAAVGAAPAVAADAAPSPTTEPQAAPPPGPVPVAAVDQSQLVEKVARQHTPCSTVLAATRPHVAQVGHFIGKTFAVSDIGGAVGRGNDDHGAGLALDFMTSDTAQGNAIAEFVLANKERFGVTYVIWQQRYNDGNGWSYMEDRGSATANHYDHVHVSFAPNAIVDLIC